MNPFRKKSPASPEPRGEDGEEEDRKGRAGVSAPVADPLDSRTSTFTDMEIPVDSWVGMQRRLPLPLSLKAEGSFFSCLLY